MPNPLYEERNRRLLDQVALKETDRTPFVFGTRFWAARFAGITFEQQMYDIDKSAAALDPALGLGWFHVAPELQDILLARFTQADDACDRKRADSRRVMQDAGRFRSARRSGREQ